MKIAFILNVMKTNRFLIMLMVVFCTTVFLSSCKKGDTGPQGEKGIAGPDGSTILNGTGAPTSATGKTGDFYLDLGSSNLYGPKTAAGWGGGLNLKGANGATGATGNTGATGASGSDGKTILSGTGIPAVNLGVDGDYYLDKTTYNFYGPKTTGAWGTPTALVGPQGPMGNANVKIDVFSVTNAEWVSNSTYWTTTTSNVAQGYFSRYYVRSAAALTSDFISGPGIVMVYFQSQSTVNVNAWSPMPYSSLENQNGAYFFNYAYETLIGSIRLHFYFSKNNGTVPTLSSYVLPTAKYKIVLITGTVVANLNAAHIDQNDRVAVAKYLGLIANQ